MVICGECEKSFNGNKKLCPQCGLPNPAREGSKEVPAPVAGDNGIDHGAGDTARGHDTAGEESSEAGGTILAPGSHNLQDDAVYEDTIKRLEEQMEQKKQREEMLKRTKDTVDIENARVLNNRVNNQCLNAKKHHIQNYEEADSKDFWKKLEELMPQ